MKHYAFSDPVEALKENGEKYVASQTVVMSEQEAVDWWRATHPYLKGLSDKEMLDEFIIINYAYPVQLVTDPNQEPQ